MTCSVNNLHVSVGEHVACRELNFELAAGTSLAILGRNGAGKSTLLNALAGLRTADSGSIMLNQRVLSEYPLRELAQQRGYCAQHQHDAFPASVLETVLIGRHPHLGRWGWESDSDTAMAQHALARVGLNDFAERQVQTLSGGERQRLALATLLVQDPDWYLLDEPLTYLDLNHAMATLALLQAEVARGKGVIAVLHDPNLARRHFDNALLLFGDGSWEYGSAQTVINRDSLHRLYGHPLRSLDDAGEAWFIPQ